VLTYNLNPNRSLDATTSYLRHLLQGHLRLFKYLNNEAPRRLPGAIPEASNGEHEYPGGSVWPWQRSALSQAAGCYISCFNQSSNLHPGPYKKFDDTVLAAAARHPEDFFKAG
jgi:hypothetical protein